MDQAVIHQPRVAWDGARAFIRAAASEYYGAFADHVFDKLGKEIYDDYERTRERIVAAAAALPDDQWILNVEAGKWRVKLEDLLRGRPDLAREVLTLTDMAPRY